MAQKSFPLNDVNYLADDLRMWFAGRSAGVINATGNDFKTDPAEMSVTVQKGYAFLKAGTLEAGGLVYGLTEAMTFAVDPADGTLNRIDALVVGYYGDQNSCGIKLIKGTPATTPAKYQPIRTSSTYELVLKYITVPKGIASLTGSNIQDCIMNEQLCGIAVDTLAKLPTGQYDAQIKAWLAELDKKWAQDVEDYHDQLDQELEQAKVQLTPYVGENGNWWVNGQDTNQKAQGPIGDPGIRGVRGVQGIPGIQGVQGPPGESGVTTPISGFYTLSVDPNGDLWVNYPDGAEPPDFELDEDGNLFVVVPDE